MSDWHSYSDRCSCETCQRERYYRWLNALLVYVNERAKR